jgi:hypothetical protein
MNGETKVLATNGEGLQSLRPGSYQVLHKQTRPVWYAPDAYFSARGLPVPPKNDGQRYRKGALGDFVVIFNKDMPLHNGPIWTQDVGGIKLSDNDLAKIYYSLEVGAPVEVR